MASEDWRSSTELKSWLLESGSAFTYVQALRLLCLFVRSESPPPAKLADALAKILIRPHLSLDFPGTDVLSIEQRTDQSLEYVLTVTFMGLYGSSSPLPTFYTEDLFDEQSQGFSAVRDFLDVINSSLYPLYFRSWGKYRLFFNLFEEIDPSVKERLYCLLGVDSERLPPEEGEYFRLLRYVGLTACGVRSAEGLRALLADSFGEPNLNVIQCAPRTANIPYGQRCCLGEAGSALGVDCYLGQEIQDQMNKFSIHIGPLDSQGFHRFFPDQPAHEEMKKLVSFYLNQPFVWDTALEIKHEEVNPVNLGAGVWSQLGWDTWIYSRKADDMQLCVVL